MIFCDEISQAVGANKQIEDDRPTESTQSRLPDAFNCISAASWCLSASRAQPQVKVNSQLSISATRLLDRVFCLISQRDEDEQWNIGSIETVNGLTSPETRVTYNARRSSLQMWNSPDLNT
jgi:hypothetical protein